MIVRYGLWSGPNLKSGGHVAQNVRSPFAHLTDRAAKECDIFSETCWKGMTLPIRELSQVFPVFNKDHGSTSPQNFWVMVDSRPPKFSFSSPNVGMSNSSEKIMEDLWDNFPDACTLGCFTQACISQ